MSGFRTVLIGSRSKCSYKSGYLVVRNEDGERRVHLSEIYSITIQDPQSVVTTYLLSEVAKMKIPLIICDDKRNPIGEYLPLHGSYNTSESHEMQHAWTDGRKKRVWKRIVQLKIQAQQAVLNDMNCNKAANSLAKFAQEIKNGDETNREAAAARVYFSALFGNTFSRDDQTPLNGCLNYGYDILLSIVNLEIVARGYPLEEGIFHRGKFNHYNLACDFMEPFRPLIDRVVLECFNPEEGLNGEMKSFLHQFVNGTVRYNDGNYKIRSVISLYVSECFKALNKKISPDEIKAYEVVACPEF